MAVVEKLIEKLAKPGVPVVRCYNKVDLLPDPNELPAEPGSVCLCARNGVGMDTLLRRIEEVLLGSLHHVTLLLPYAEAGVLEILHQQAQVLSVDYTGEGVSVETVCSEELYGRYRRFEKEPEA